MWWNVAVRAFLNWEVGHKTVETTEIALVHLDLVAHFVLVGDNRSYVPAGFNTVSSDAAAELCLAEQTLMIRQIRSKNE